jgi:hypothetical protein
MMRLIALSGGDEIALARLPVKTLFALAEPTLKEAAARQNVRLQFYSGEESFCMDADLMVSVLINLADNAMAAGAKNVQVACAANAIILHDDGCGIPKALLGRVTQPFFRADKARGRAKGNAGLGLALVERIAKLHGAALEIESEEGAGTTSPSDSENTIKYHAATPYKTLTTHCGLTNRPRGMLTPANRKEVESDMKQRIRIVTLMLAGSLALSLCACAGSEAPANSAPQPKVERLALEQPQGETVQSGGYDLPSGNYVWDETRENGYLRIHVNAEVTAPDIAPAAAGVTAGGFTQVQIMFVQLLVAIRRSTRRLGKTFKQDEIKIQLTREQALEDGTIPNWLKSGRIEQAIANRKKPTATRPRGYKHTDLTDERCRP